MNESRPTEMNSYFSSPMGWVHNYDAQSATENHRMASSADNIAETSSLLTFADMVIALDHQNESSFDGDGSNIEDHNYASSICLNMSSSEDSDLDLSDDDQSSALLAELDSITSDPITIQNNCGSSHFRHNLFKDNIDDKTDLSANDESYAKHNNQCFNFDDHNHSNKGHINKYQKRFNHNTPKACIQTPVKRSSSVENVQSFVPKMEIFSSSSNLTNSNIKTSPRKSCSFEEVNSDHQSLMKSSKSTENIQKRTAVSHQLHRVVNDNLEFPSWPRKADHTYATATWDGTAASHSLFEQESRQDEQKVTSTSIEQTQGFQEMEVSESIIPVRGSTFPDINSKKTDESLKYPVVNLSQQRDDHTYTMKSKTVSKLASQTAPKSSLQTVSTTKPLKESIEQCCRDWIRGNSKGTPVNVVSTGTSDFSSATFPRQKMRDDHTYFHSGLNKKDSFSKGRDWVSEQTVMVMECSDNDNAVFHVKAHAVQQTSSSTSKASSKSDKRDDHNYSTSA